MNREKTKEAIKPKTREFWIEPTEHWDDELAAYNTKSEWQVTNNAIKVREVLDD